MTCQKDVLHSQGVRFQRINGLTYDTIAQVKDITPPAQTRSEIDVTTIDQYDDTTPNIHKHFVGGLIDDGNVSLELIFDPDSASNQRTLEADIEADCPIQYRILYRNGMTRDFYAVLKEITPTNAMDDILRQTLSFKVSGKVTVTYPE